MINEDKTLKLLGIDIKNLKPNSHKKVYWNCNKCNLEKPRIFVGANKFKLCLKCSNKINANLNLEKRAEKTKIWHQNNPHPLLGTKRPENVILAIKNRNTDYMRTEQFRKNRSERSKGSKNNFYNKKHSEESLVKMRTSASKNVRRGKDSNFYGKIYHGKGEWFIDRKENRYYLRSSWEVKYAKYLDNIEANWLYEPKFFEFKLNGKDVTYTPDFYFPNGDFYVEIKGYWRNDAREKFEQFKINYPHIKIYVYGKKELKHIGLF